MVFLYRYEDRKRGVLEGEVAAPSLSEAHSRLRKSGIHPMNVWRKPGLLNLLSAIGKRGTAIIVLGVLCVVLFVFLLRAPNSAAPDSALRAPRTALSPLPRQQLPAVDVRFAFEAERTLALFARPGEVALLPENPAASLSLDDLEASLRKPLAIGADDSQDAITLKRIVAGMKSEVGVMMASGDRPGDILGWLVERQRMEAAHREGIVSEVRGLAGGATKKGVDDANASLRAMKFREIGENEL